MNDLQPVALGERPADLVVRNGTVLSPESGTLRERDVAVLDDRIAALPASAESVVDADTTVVDAAGCTVVPGFVDAHTHVDLGPTVETAYHQWLLGGTTAVVTESSSIASSAGPDGVRALLDAAADLPVTVRPTVPPQWLIDTFEPARATEAEAEALEALLADDRIAGVGEIGWIHIVGRDCPVERLVERAHELGKPVVGHGAGVRGEKLAAFATVVDDDHEAITGEGAIERVEAGLHVVGRSGSVRDDLDAVVAASEELGAAELSLSTDGVEPRDLLAEGYMDVVVRETIEAGVPPTDAVRMATLNPARHYGLDDRGSLAPGDVADLVVLSDLESVAVRDVIVGGEVVVRDGEALVGPREHAYPDEVSDTVAGSVSPGRFHVPASRARDGRVRAIDCGSDAGPLTRETVVEPPVSEEDDGPVLTADPDRDLLLAGLFERTVFGEEIPTADSNQFTGFLAGLGLEAGAVATTETWECPGLLVVGTDPEAMAAAVEHVTEMGGGWAVYHDGVLADLPMPVGAMASALPVEETADRYERIESTMDDLGCSVDRPLLALGTLTFTGVPALKLTPSGYADVLGRELVGLAVEGRERSST